MSPTLTSIQATNHAQQIYAEALTRKAIGAITGTYPEGVDLQNITVEDLLQDRGGVIYEEDNLAGNLGNVLNLMSQASAITKNASTTALNLNQIG